MCTMQWEVFEVNVKSIKKSTIIAIWVVAKPNQLAEPSNSSQKVEPDSLIEHNLVSFGLTWLRWLDFFLFTCLFAK